jgi:hypothetical protein
MTKVGHEPSHLRPNGWVQGIMHAFDGQGVEADSQAMQAYMKNHFPFLGHQKAPALSPDSTLLGCTDLWQTTPKNSLD